MHRGQEASTTTTTTVMPNSSSHSISFSSLNYERFFLPVSVFFLSLSLSRSMIESIALFVVVLLPSAVAFIVWRRIVWHCLHPCLTCISFSSHSCCVSVHDMALCPHCKATQKCTYCALISMVFIFFFFLSAVAVVRQLLLNCLVALLQFRFLLSVPLNLVRGNTRYANPPSLLQACSLSYSATFSKENSFDRISNSLCSM